jgi:tRNA A-37 threonylcarbamoyl transferase component Bud32
LHFYLYFCKGQEKEERMKIVIAPQFQKHVVFIRQIPRLIDEGEGTIVYDGRNRVVRLEHEGETMMVKCFKRVNIIQQIVYTFFRKSKAERAFLFAGEFSKRGISTPQRIAFLEEKRWGLFLKGYFVSKEVEGTECHLLLREVKEFSPQLADAVMKQTVLMHSKGILHGDLNLSNFLCVEKSGDYYFNMIDINRSRFCDGYPSNNDCLKNLVRTTHRRDLYEYLIASYARQRGWDEKETVQQAVALLDRFEHRKFKL